MTLVCVANKTTISSRPVPKGRAWASHLSSALVIAALAVLTWSAPARAAGASETVDRFHTGLVNALKATNGKDFDARRTALKPVIESSFDSGFMARIAAGSTWDTLTPAQRGELTKAFRDMTIANYAARFKSYNGQTFVVTGSEEAPNDRSLVHTQLNRKKGDPVKIDYVLHKDEVKTGKAQTWSIMDVRLNGSVSELALRRSEFSPVLRDKGFDALLSVLKEKVVALASAPSDVEPASAKP